MARRSAGARTRAVRQAHRRRSAAIRRHPKSSRPSAPGIPTPANRFVKTARRSAGADYRPTVKQAHRKTGPSGPSAAGLTTRADCGKTVPQCAGAMTLDVRLVRRAARLSPPSPAGPPTVRVAGRRIKAVCWGNDDFGAASPPDDKTFTAVSAGSTTTRAGCGKTAGEWSAGGMTVTVRVRRKTRASSSSQAGAYTIAGLRENGSAV